jgi:phage terminase large subunit GpA-like protein
VRRRRRGITAPPATTRCRSTTRPPCSSGGEWRATAEGQDPHTIGFHISALYSPVGWLSWAQIARDWEAAQGKPEDIKTFKNTVLGETWQEQGEAPDWERLVERREDFRHGRGA